MSVTVSCDPQTVVPGDDAYLNFTAVVSGTPDPLGECTAENESWVWLDGTTGQSDIIDYTVPSDTTATTITVPDSVTVSYTSSCDGSAGSAIGAGSATINVDLSTCG
jgi:hypothetical protein